MICNCWQCNADPEQQAHYERQAEAMTKEQENAEREKIWTCKIGGVKNTNLPAGADAPLRQAVYTAYFKLTGKEADFCFSGWGGSLTETERAVINSFEKTAKIKSDSSKAEPVGEIESLGLTPFDLDQWFFEHPEVIKPPELCRNGREKIVYFASEVEAKFNNDRERIAVLTLANKIHHENETKLRAELAELRKQLPEMNYKFNCPKPGSSDV